MDLHLEVLLVAILGLVHFQMPFLLFVFGGARRRDQGIIKMVSFRIVVPRVLR